MPNEQHKETTENTNWETKPSNHENLYYGPYVLGKHRKNQLLPKKEDRLLTKVQPEETLESLLAQLKQQYKNYSAIQQPAKKLFNLLKHFDTLATHQFYATDIGQYIRQKKLNKNYHSMLQVLHRDIKNFESALTKKVSVKDKELLLTKIKETHSTIEQWPPYEELSNNYNNIFKVVKVDDTQKIKRLKNPEDNKRKEFYKTYHAINNRQVKRYIFYTAIFLASTATAISLMVLFASNPVVLGLGLLTIAGTIGALGISSKFSLCRAKKAEEKANIKTEKKPQQHNRPSPQSLQNNAAIERKVSNDYKYCGLYNGSTVPNQKQLKKKVWNADQREIRCTL